MASGKAHHASGWAAGVIAAGLVANAGAGGPYQLWSLLALAAGISGGSAPDWLEVAWWRSGRKLWIEHRTWTHWGCAWLALLVGSYCLLGKMELAALTFGFAVGGVMHLLADWPNPMGVPWIYKRHSLNLWKSGNCDAIIIVVAWIGAIILWDHVYFHDLVSAHLIAFISSSRAA